MSEKKKQASIAAFFSPQAKSSAAAPSASSANKPKPTPSPAAKSAAKQPSESAAAAEAVTGAGDVGASSSKKRAKSADAPAGGAKRQRASSSPKARAAAETATLLVTPPPTATVVDAVDAAMAIVVNLNESTSEAAVPQRTIVDLFTTPPPTKRAKANGTAAVAAASETAASPEMVLEPVVSAALVASPTHTASSDDDVLSDDDDMDGGPHAMGGPHAPAPTPREYAAAKTRTRRTKQSKQLPAATSKSKSTNKSGATANTAAASSTMSDAVPSTATLAGAAPKAKDKRSRAAKDRAGATEPAAADTKSVAAAAPPVMAPPPPPPAPVVLDPLVKARVATYQQKIDELTQQCARFLQTPAPSDAILHEIYGVAVDLGLELPECTSESVAVAVTALFEKLSGASPSASSSSSTSSITASALQPDAVTGLAPELKQFIARSVQGQGASLSSLSHQLVQTLEASYAATSTTAAPDAGPQAIDASVRARVLVMLEMEIKMLAQRTNYGVRPARANVFEDTSAAALWVWEVGSVDKYFGDDAQRVIKRMRKHRKRLGAQLKSLARVVQLLHATPVDEVKVSAEEARVGKFVLAVESETQRAQDRERKELEKVHVAEQRRHQELEREQARAEEKRKRDEDEQNERALADKRKQSLVSYFRSIDKSSGSAAAAVAPVGGDTAAGTCADTVPAASDMGDAALSLTERHKLRRSSAQRELMARMDAAVAFLVGGDVSSDAPPASPHASTDSVIKSARDVLGGNRKSVTRVSAALGHWSSRRRRDAALGVMKLLQFHENYRPAYYGTFSARSSVFRGGRRPLARYTAFDYSVDSEEEWEEEEPGESLSDADSDVDESDDDLDYGDQWLAYEDEVDYMDGAANDGDDDGDNGDGSAGKREKKLPAQLEHRKRVRSAGRKKAVKPAKLEPQIVGPFEDPAVAAAHWSGACTGELLCVPQFESPLLRRAREHDEARVRQQQLEQQQQLQAATAAAAAEAAVKTAATDKLGDTSIGATLLKTPVKTPQKRKLSVENARLTSPHLKAVSAASVTTASTSTTASTAPVKAGITAWLKKPAVVDLRGSITASDAPTATPVPKASDTAVVDLSTVESDA